jgi:hypothetical protein
MTFRVPVKVWTAAGATLVVACAGVWIWAQGGAGQLSAARARDLLQHLGGAEFARNQVRIKSVNGGVGSGGTMVEAQIETAVRFTEQNGEWRAAEIRLGDRHWESVDLILEAVRREKIRRTEAMLSRIAEGLEAYRRERGSYVVAENLDGLINALDQRFLDPRVRFDLWQQPLSYRGTATTFRLSSSGPDRQPGTSDDLVVANGQAKAAQ